MSPVKVQGSAVESLMKLWLLRIFYIFSCVFCFPSQQFKEQNINSYFLKEQNFNDSIISVLATYSWNINLLRLS